MALDEDRVVDVGESGGSAPSGLARAPARPPYRGPAAIAVPPKPPAPRRRPVKRLVLATVLLAAAGYAGHLGYDWWTDGRFLVGTDDAYVRGDITILAANAEGYVRAVEVTDNQTVRAGDVIARIDDGDYRLALQAARDRLATQESAIARIGRQVEAARLGVTKAEAAVDAAKADATHAAAEFERQSQLSRTDYTSRARMDEATWDRARSQAAIRSAEAALAAERANVEVLQAQQTEAERVAGEFQTAVAQAELESREYPGFYL